MIDTETEYFIEKNINLIESNDWDTLYKKSTFLIPIGWITEILHGAGIYPLTYLDYIPRFYLNDSYIEELRIPKNIRKLFPSSFLGAKMLTDIYYEGTKEEWRNLIKNNDLDIIEKVKIHCIDGDY